MGLTLLNLKTERITAENTDHAKKDKSRSLDTLRALGMTPKSLEALEAASPAELFGNDPYGYRPIGAYRGLGTGHSPRDLMPPMHARMQQVAYYLYLVNPLAHRIVEYTKNYVVGDGAAIKAESTAAQRVIEAFWLDPVNRVESRCRKSSRNSRSSGSSAGWRR